MLPLSTATIYEFNTSLRFFIFQNQIIPIMSANASASVAARKTTESIRYPKLRLKSRK
jgi:hypothetical protein